jgi:hypothetical protein
VREPAVSREELALEISRVVARLAGGEPIDVAEESGRLSSKYAEVGMSRDMINEAIMRAAGMVGMIKSAPEPDDWPDPAETPLLTPPPADLGPSDAAPREEEAAALPVLAESIDDDLAAAIDVEIGNLVTGRATTSAKAPARNREPAERHEDGPENGPFAPVAAVLRRAFLRH